MKTEAIVHTGAPPDLYLTARNCLHIRIRAARDDLIKCELVFFTRTSPQRRRKYRMKCAMRDGQSDYYESEIRFPQTARYLKYYFALEDGAGCKRWLNAWGICEHEPEDGFFEFLYANEKDCIRIPEWANGLIYYQIFPERFCNGDPDNDPPGCVPWGTRPDRDHYMGGDLAGIRSKLQYLEDLGVECLYLTPIFQADFNHKYATTDYFQVDPSFGTKEELRQLVKECHDRGIRVILDGVFNHCGVHFQPFLDLLEHQEDSRFRDWFLVTRYPVTVSQECYECVGAYPWMPKLNTAKREVRQFILDVMGYWLREAGIDGWRLDVADEVDGSVWTLARTELKEAFPDCLLLGETWGSGLKMMLGNQMDSIMNYGFRDALRDYLAWERLDASGFDRRINRMLAAYPNVLQGGLYNMLDSHDTERFLTLCRGDTEKMKLAAALQMLLPGAPAIYYGDEVGMEGENDPDCRRAFPWDESLWKKDLYAWYQELISLRKKEPAIRAGDFAPNLCDGLVYGFCRRLADASVYVVCNPGEEKRIHIPVEEQGRYGILFSGMIPDAAESLKKGGFLWAKAQEGPVFYRGDITEYGGMITVTVPKRSVFVIKRCKQKKEEKA